LFSIKFSDYGTTIVDYVQILKLTATFRRLHFNFLKRPLHYNDCSSFNKHFKFQKNGFIKTSIIPDHSEKKNRDSIHQSSNYEIILHFQMHNHIFLTFVANARSISDTFTRMPLTGFLVMPLPTRQTSTWVFWGRIWVWKCTLRPGFQV